MVGPVNNGIQQQQIPAANTFQPGGNEQVREQQEVQEQTRPAGTSASETQSSETRNNGEERSPALQAQNTNDATEFQASGDERPGSIVDITV